MAPYHHNTTLQKPRDSKFRRKEEENIKLIYATTLNTHAFSLQLHLFQINSGISGLPETFKQVLLQLFRAMLQHCFAVKLQKHFVDPDNDWIFIFERTVPFINNKSNCS